MSKRMISCLLILVLLLPVTGAMAAPVEDGGSGTEVDSDIGFAVIPEAVDATYTARVGEGLRIVLGVKNRAPDLSYEFNLMGDRNLQHGSLSPTGERGVYNYHPLSPGAETFTFTVTANGITSDPATVNITVTGQSPPAFLQYRDMVGHWASFAAGRLAILDLVVGQKADSRYYFHPNKAISRGDFLIWLCAVMGIEPTEHANTLYADHDMPGWLVGFIDAATNAGVIEGVPATRPHVTSYFYPRSPITRIEAIAMVSRALGVEGHDENLAGLFQDVEQIPGWGKNHVRHLSEIKVIVGDHKDNLQPNRNLSRGEAAEMLYKAFKEQIELRAGGR